MTTRLHHHNPAEATFAPYGLIEADQDLVRVGASNGLLTAGTVAVDRAEFLRAVETELNVKIINRADLPKVTEGPDGSLNARGATLTSDGNAYGSDALGWHAIAEYLEAHPPVDQADVDALTQHLYAATTDPNDIDVPDVALRLVQAGVRPPKAD